MKQKKALFVFGLCFSLNLFAVEVSQDIQVQTAYYFPHHEGYGTSSLFLPVDYSLVPRDEAAAGIPGAVDPGRSIGSSWGAAEAKVIFNHRRRYPFLTGPGNLYKDNNIGLRFSAELSPVSVNAVAQFSLTPVAFLQFHTGFSIGTGWSLGFNGLGRNLPGPEYDEVQREPFSGAVVKVWQAASFQFDLAAVVPGKWTHVVLMVTGRPEYICNTAADRDQAWLWEADRGENFNGLRLHGSYFLGYRMPFFVETVGFLLETVQWIDHNAARSLYADSGWGSNFVKMTFGPLVNLDFGENGSCAVLFQFQNGIDYSDATAGYRYFAYREAEGTYIRFHRVAFSYTYKL